MNIGCWRSQSVSLSIWGISRTCLVAEYEFILYFGRMKRGIKDILFRTWYGTIVRKFTVADERERDER
jgi:hypothetical protein